MSEKKEETNLVNSPERRNALFQKLADLFASAEDPVTRLEQMEDDFRLAFNFWHRFTHNKERNGMQKEIHIHTLDVIRAVMALVRRDSDTFNDGKTGDRIRYGILYKATKDPAKSDHAAPGTAGFSYHDRITLGFAALMHDFGNMTVTKGHERESKEITEKILKEVPGWILPERCVEDICWLVGTHTYMGGTLFYGELSPALVLRTLRDEADRDSAKRRVRLLALLGLADLRGTASGRYLTEKKADFIATQDLESLEKLEEKLFETRVKRFTGAKTVDGTPCEENENRFRDEFNGLDSAHQELVRHWFGKQIVQIDNAIGHFIFMGPVNVLKVMIAISKVFRIAGENSDRKMECDRFAFATRSSSPEDAGKLENYWKTKLFPKTAPRDVSTLIQEGTLTDLVNPNRTEPVNIEGLLLGVEDKELIVCTNKM